ncbi:SCAN domain-containing protein 3, partial [Trichinella sp. T9]
LSNIVRVSRHITYVAFSAPSILQSDNGQEFSNAIIAELKTYWPELKLVTGRPRQPQSQ